MNNETKNANEIGSNINGVDKEVNLIGEEFNTKIDALKEEINSLISDINVDSENLIHDFNKLNFLKEKITIFLANLKENSSFNGSEINYENKLQKTLELFSWRIENCEKKIKNRIENGEDNKKEENFDIQNEKFSLIGFDINSINIDNAWQLFDNYFDNPKIDVSENREDFEQKLKIILKVILENDERNFDVLEANVLKKIFNSKINVGKKVDFYNSLISEVKKDLEKRNQEVA